MKAPLKINSVADNCPSKLFCFFFLGAIGVKDVDINCLFVFGFGMVWDKKYGIRSMWHSFPHTLR